MTDKLELKSCHEVVYTVDVADVESIFYCKPTDPDILTVLMKDGKRLYCDEVCPIDSMQEEPVSEELKTELNKYIKDYFTIDREQLDRFGIEEKDYMYTMDKSDMLKMLRHFTNNFTTPISEDLEEAAKVYASDTLCVTNEEDWDNDAIEVLNSFKAGAKWQKNNLWKPADGDDLPEIDREVIALQEIFPEEIDVESLLKVVIAHRPNPNGWDGRSISTGKVEHYTPKTYEGGWNLPNVKYWLDVPIPDERQSFASDKDKKKLGNGETKYNLRGIITGKPSPAVKEVVDSLTPEIMDEAKKELEQDSEEEH
jgi:hypothetical protein